MRDNVLWMRESVAGWRLFVCVYARFSPFAMLSKFSNDFTQSKCAQRDVIMVNLAYMGSFDDACSRTWKPLHFNVDE